MKVGASYNLSKYYNKNLTKILTTNKIKLTLVFIYKSNRLDSITVFF